MNESCKSHRLAGYLVSSIISGIGRAGGFFWHGIRGSGFSIGRLFGGHGPILNPGDPTPPADKAGDYYDYRGIAEPREVGPLNSLTGVSLGRYLWPTGRRGPHLRLPNDILCRNCAVIGPPGSGKTEGIIIPWILDLLSSGASVVTVDIKGDMIDRLAAEARKIGVRLWYWNSADPRRSMSWNWLTGIRDARDIEAAVQSILGRPRPNDPQPFFYERDYRWLRTLIAIVCEVHGSSSKPQNLYEIVGDQEELRDLFRNHSTIRSHAAEVADLLQFPVDEHSRAVSGLLNALHLFNTPDVRAVSERCDFTLAAIATNPTLLIIGASLADARSAEVLSSIILNQLIAFIYRRFGPSGSGTPMALYFMLDEAPRLKERIAMEEFLSVARSAHVGICLAAQDVGQYGNERAYTALLSNCLTIIAMPGCSPETARYFSSRLGHRMERQISSNQQRGPWDLLPQQVGQTAQTIPVPVLREREIMHPPIGTWCATVQIQPLTSRPFLVDLTRT